MLNRDDLQGCDVYLFEPNPHYRRTLEDLKKSNKDFNFHVRTEALWIENGEIDYYEAIDVWGDVGNTIMPDNTQKKKLANKVECIRLSEFILSLNHDRVILKLDIEGAEYKILNDLIETGAIKNIDELYIEWHDQFMPGCYKDYFIDKLADITFHTWSH